MLTHFLQSVPLASIRHNDLPSYRAEGFGGRPIEEWPVYRFFKMYREGERETATRNFEDWYRDQLEKYSAVSKERGGMYRGSLYNLIEKRCGVSFGEAGDECVREAIRERVVQRLSLLDTIRDRGYQSGESERIDAIRKGGLVYLAGGHHRAAILRALGRDELPGVLVFPNRFVYNLFNFLRKIKHGNI